MRPPLFVATLRKTPFPRARQSGKTRPAPFCTHFRPTCPARHSRTVVRPATVGPLAAGPTSRLWLRRSRPTAGPSRWGCPRRFLSAEPRRVGFASRLPRAGRRPRAPAPHVSMLAVAFCAAVGHNSHPPRLSPSRCDSRLPLAHAGHRPPRSANVPPCPSCRVRPSNGARLFRRDGEPASDRPPASPFLSRTLSFPATPKADRGTIGRDQDFGSALGQGTPPYRALAAPLGGACTVNSPRPLLPPL